MGTVLDAIVQVLSEANEPLHYQDITQAILEKKLWETEGQTPWSTVNVTISLDLRDHGSNSRFVRVKRGVYALRNRLNESTSEIREEGSNPLEDSLSFNDAAELVLEEADIHDPIHYRELMKRILDRKLITTASQSPEATLYASIHQEIERFERQGETPRFYKRKGGLIGLNKWLPKGIEGDIYARNSHMREKLLDKVKKMDPAEFEKLISLLLIKMGFDDVETTQYHNDGGIDVRGTLVEGDVIRTKMAIQVKRWKQNIQAQTVREVRGSLGAHEQGLVITTSDFSVGARTEAERADAIPIALMSGKQLARLLTEHQIGIKRKPSEIFELVEIDVQELADEE